MLSFAVAQEGQYRIDAAVFAPSGSADSFWITVDGLPASAYLWDLAAGGAYQIDSVNDRNGADPVLVTLAAGAHTVEVIHRETGARLDWMRLVYVGPPPPPPDSDGDGVPDASDAFPNDPTEWADTDGDGVGDNSDAFPTDPTRWLPEHGVTPVAAPHHSTTLIVETSSGADRAWNVNPDHDTVTVIGAAGAVVAEIAVGDQPWSLAKAPLANEVFVANKGSATISVIDTLSLAVVRTIALPAASQPHGLAFAPAGDVVLRGARGARARRPALAGDGRARGERGALGPAAASRRQRRRPDALRHELHHAAAAGRGRRRDRHERGRCAAVRRSRPTRCRSRRRSRSGGRIGRPPRSRARACPTT